MKKLLLILLITNSLFAQEKTTSAFLYWTPLAVWGDETWAFGNKVGLGIERKLSKKFDLRFNINNGNYTRSAGNVVSNYSKSSIVNVDLDSRFMFSRNRRINVFVETGVNYSRFHTYEIEIVFEHEIYKTYDIYRENFIYPYAKTGLRIGKENKKFLVELSLIEYNPYVRSLNGKGFLKLMLRLK